MAHQLNLSLVPGIHTHIALVTQNAVQAVLTNGSSPLTNLSFQGVQDSVVALSSGIHGKDLPHNGGLVLVDDIFAVNDIIAQRWHTAQEHTLACFDSHTVDALLAVGQHLVLSHADGDQLQQEGISVGNVAQRLSGGDNLDAQQGHTLAESEPVSHITAATGNIIDHHGVKGVLLRTGQKGAKTRAVRIGAALAFVCVGSCDLDLLFGAVHPDFIQLICD